MFLRLYLQICSTNGESESDRAENTALTVLSLYSNQLTVVDPSTFSHGVDGALPVLQPIDRC